MDFMRILRSLEELVYEVITWFVFYPRTLLRSFAAPLEMLDFSRREMEQPEEQRNQTTISAPLFLILTLVISHLIELAAHVERDPLPGSNLSFLFTSDQNLILLRSIAFAVFPMAFAVEQFRHTGTPLTRDSLRGPFFSECYPAAVFCLIFGIGHTLGRSSANLDVAGTVLMVLAVSWYLCVQTLWLKRAGRGWGRAAFVAIRCFVRPLLLAFAVIAAIVLAN